MSRYPLPGVSHQRGATDRGVEGLPLMAIKLHPSFAVHPGVWLKSEIIEPHGLSATGTAEKLGVTRQAISTLVNGHAGLSAEMAIRFEKAFGVSADTLMRMRAREKEIRVERVVDAA